MDAAKPASALPRGMPETATAATTPNTRVWSSTGIRSYRTAPTIGFTPAIPKPAKKVTISTTVRLPVNPSTRISGAPPIAAPMKKVSICGIFVAKIVKSTLPSQ